MNTLYTPIIETNRKIISVLHLAFLAHLRDGDFVLPLPEVASKFKWSFDYRHFLRMNPRISACTQSYLASRLVDILSPLVVACSSKDSLNLEISALQAVNRMCLNGFEFDNELCLNLLGKLRKQMELLELECHDFAGKSFNLDSSIQVSENENRNFSFQK
ncbi:hypothetical protein DICVIV_10509 [Dictyocaulus viviparus]|uniref:Uncharacterized protein n=1 Tax=Dictyocaulus viviparus TaxID=29172 RepID=A0A0D8XFL8_DICVI|nr:hypothetical protein DICVIV_10509 [Dictyocaulus viviparus]